ncbi:uncharacterized protein LOC117176918 isoform X1 [Belonocnema kinseyi]|uniref:uncharacterized protein LOC117176918 isoform X1 n=1 Tax=Belonocnema kinseyi TaxID=2817044 RepID=UPI00143D2ABA|nr:uncharacterized protein LOC117176918 isoform X1 [Belonocnema kinseyi]XP_033223199.1 uncharacterized protein LOC117176918 isoform X1 [Belonocnema kinseyi]XP_033223200.1 uncharacterized protein LOC117176918 isoform X1 [Belonocnema kinseyi]
MGYDNFTCSVDHVKTFSQIARNLAVAIFGYNTLKNATITGRGMNRNKGITKPQYKLDNDKMLCLKDIFKYYLIEKLKVADVLIDEEMDKVRNYIRSKISDLKRIDRKAAAKPQMQGPPTVCYNSAAFALQGQGSMHREEEISGEESEEDKVLQPVESDSDELPEENNSDNLPAENDNDEELSDYEGISNHEKIRGEADHAVSQEAVREGEFEDVRENISRENEVEGEQRIEKRIDTEGKN